MLLTQCGYPYYFSSKLLSNFLVNSYFKFLGNLLKSYMLLGYKTHWVELLKKKIVIKDL